MRLLIFEYSPLDLLNFLTIVIIAFVILIKLIPLMIRVLEQPKSTICIMNNKGRCNSAYAKGKKCNGITPAEECPYVCKAELQDKQK